MTYEIHIKVYEKDSDNPEVRAEAFTVEATSIADLESKLSAVAILTESSVDADPDMTVLTWRND